MKDDTARREAEAAASALASQKLLQADVAKAVQDIEATAEGSRKLSAEVAESGRWLGRTELRALKRGHLGARSVHRNLVPTPGCGVKALESSGKLLHFRKIPKHIWSKFCKY